jgi:hypothetical protein
VFITKPTTSANDECANRSCLGRDINRSSSSFAIIIMMSVRLAVMALSSFLLISSVNIGNVHAYSTGAGGCTGGMAAVGGPHLTNGGTPQVLSFAELGYEFVVAAGFAGERIIAADAAVETVRNATTSFSVRATGGATFKGVLIRMDGPGSVAPDFNSQMATACDKEGVLGVTHTDATPKTLLTWQQRLEGDYAVLHVTMVKSNNAVDGSVYSYRQVRLVGIAPPSRAPTAAPVGVPATPSVAPINVIVPVDMGTPVAINTTTTTTSTTTSTTTTITTTTSTTTNTPPPPSPAGPTSMPKYASAAPASPPTPVSSPTVPTSPNNPALTTITTNDLSPTAPSSAAAASSRVLTILVAGMGSGAAAAAWLSFL